MKNKIILLILIILTSTGCKKNTEYKEESINTFIYRLINTGSITNKSTINNELTLTLNDLINNYNYIYKGTCNKNNTTIKITFDEEGKVANTTINLSCDIKEESNIQNIYFD